MLLVPFESYLTNNFNHFRKKKSLTQMCPAVDQLNKIPTVRNLVHRGLLYPKGPVRDTSLLHPSVILKDLSSE